MVFYFTSSEGYTIYMGRDKHENEDLIKHGFLEDIWFHVDNLSSAHVYLRLPMGKSRLDDIPPKCLEECAQLVKDNSIEGSKLKRVQVIYTKWKNLKKTQGMQIGEVGFNHPDRVRKCDVDKDRDIVKMLNKTKEEKYPDLEEERRERELLYKAERKKQRLKLEAEEKKQKQAYKELAEQRNYSSLFSGDYTTGGDAVEGSSDLSSARAFEDDFM